jgi:hypothetical protein
MDLARLAQLDKHPKLVTSIIQMLDPYAVVLLLLLQLQLLPQLVIHAFCIMV